MTASTPASSSVRHTSRPTAGSTFYKAHGLGNDYLVFEAGGDWLMDEAGVARVCNRFSGPGGDGIVLLEGDRGDGLFHLRMFNPDGSEFERSGNGLRVLASYLARVARVDTHPFTVEVGGDHVSMTVHASAGAVHDISVAMGTARVGPAAVALDPRALDGDGRLAGPDGAPLDVTPVSVGNPHLVVWGQDLTDEILRTLGPYLTAHPALTHGANVQIARVREPGTCEALIWERGVGRTSASGTSSCAVAVAAVSRATQPPGPVTIAMEGGELRVDVSSRLEVVLRGPVEEVYEGRLTAGFLSSLSGDGA